MSDAQGKRDISGTLKNVVAALLGFSGFSLILTANVSVTIDTTPERARHGWAGADVVEAQADETARAVGEFRLVDPETGVPVVQDNAERNVRLWEPAVQLLGEHVPNYPQQVGDCVSFGAKNAIAYLQLVQIASDPWQDVEYREPFPPYIYGISRVQVGGGRLSGDGSIGAWAARGVQEPPDGYGVLADDAKDCPQYSGRVARDWGRHGPPETFIDKARETAVREVGKVTRAEDVRDAICNGYPCTIASNFGTRSIRERDGRMVARWNGSWAHQMSVVGYDGSAESGERYFYVLNSWGARAHPQPLQNEPPGGFWVVWDDMDRIVRQGDSFAFSSFEGFPARDPFDFRVIAADQRAVQAIRRKVRFAEPVYPTVTLSERLFNMNTVTATTAGAGAVLAAAATKLAVLRSLVAAVLLCLGLFGGSASADEPFRVMRARAASPSTEDVAFRVIAPETPSTVPVVDLCPCGEICDCRLADVERLEAALVERDETIAALEDALGAKREAAERRVTRTPYRRRYDGPRRYVQTPSGASFAAEDVAEHLIRYRGATPELLDGRTEDELRALLSDSENARRSVPQLLNAAEASGGVVARVRLDCSSGTCRFVEQ